VSLLYGTRSQTRHRAYPRRNSSMLFFTMSNDCRASSSPNIQNGKRTQRRRNLRQMVLLTKEQPAVMKLVIIRLGALSVMLPILCVTTASGSYTTIFPAPCADNISRRFASTAPSCRAKPPQKLFHPLVRRLARRGNRTFLSILQESRHKSHLIVRIESGRGCLP
jgi:hypothetical protein